MTNAISFPGWSSLICCTYRFLLRECRVTLPCRTGAHLKEEGVKASWVGWLNECVAWMDRCSHASTLSATGQLGSIHSSSGQSAPLLEAEWESVEEGRSRSNLEICFQMGKNKQRFRHLSKTGSQEIKRNLRTIGKSLIPVRSKPMCVPQ
uniref:Uncharacterized protein n=1 Tax=Mus spicilegus TaxID=10103 RepID=A0A8C6IFT2_MUSSI